jgi:hypothetical protein
VNWRQALALAGVMMLLPAVPVKAQEYDGPGSCLVVYNYRSHNVAVEIVFPAGYEGKQWEFVPGEDGRLTLEGRNVLTPTGHWDTRISPGRMEGESTSWRYEKDSNRSSGCNGSWVMTLR